MAAVLQQKEGFRSQADRDETGGVSPEEYQSLVDESTRRMAVGFEAMSCGDWLGAAEHFRIAAADREKLPWREDVEAAWLLSACWLNLGDVLVRAGDSALLREALASLDRAIETMGPLDMNENPAFQDRLILALLNRAGAWSDYGDSEAALRDFAQAESMLEKWRVDATPMRQFLAAMLPVNRARTIIGSGRVREAWTEAKRGLGLLSAVAPTYEAALAGIHARSIQCHVLARLLDEPDGAASVGDWIAEATDAAEQALALVRETRFHGEWVADLVRYGAMIYRACQPHFLGEFLTEWLGAAGPLSGDDALKAEMRQVLWRAIADTERKVLAAPHETEFVEKQTRVLSSLQAGLSGLA